MFSFPGYVSKYKQSMRSIDSTDSWSNTPAIWLRAFPAIALEK